MKKHTPKQLTALALAGVFFLAGCNGDTGGGDESPSPSESTQTSPSSLGPSPSQTEAKDPYPAVVKSDVPKSGSEAIDHATKVVRNLYAYTSTAAGKYDKVEQQALKRYLTGPALELEDKNSKAKAKEGYTSTGKISIRVLSSSPTFEVTKSGKHGDPIGALLKTCIDSSEISWKDGKGKPLMEPPVPQRKVDYNVVRDSKTGEWKIRTKNLLPGKDGYGEPC